MRKINVFEVKCISLRAQPWLQNRKGLVMDLKAKREGLMLSLGADVVLIEMNSTGDKFSQTQGPNSLD